MRSKCSNNALKKDLQLLGRRQRCQQERLPAWGGKQAKVGNGVYYTRQAHKYGHAVRPKCTQNALKVLKQCNEKRLTTSGAAAALSAGAVACFGGEGEQTREA
jgi:hypothetical protein